MKRERASLVTMGIPSLFLIFSVLCLVILSLLTLGTSRSDLSASLRSMEQTDGYYDACSSAAELCEKADAFLTKLRSESRNSEEYYSRAAEWQEESFQWNEDTGQFRLELPFSDTQELIVELKALYPLREGEPCTKITVWETGTTGSWNPDTRQPVYKKEPSTVPRTK